MRIVDDLAEGTADTIPPVDQPATPDAKADAVAPDAAAKLAADSKPAPAAAAKPEGAPGEIATADTGRIQLPSKDKDAG
jgi:hypothetical protein